MNSKLKNKQKNDSDLKSNLLQKILHDYLSL